MHPYAQRSPILIPVFLYRFNLLSNDVSVSVLNSVQASYFHKMNSLFLQPHRFLFISPIQGILSFYRQKVFFLRGDVVSRKTPNMDEQNNPFLLGHHL